VALTVAQYEEILAVLRRVSPLVDVLESRNAGFYDEVLDWLRLAEKILTDVRLPAASEVAACRGRLIEAGRGAQPAELSFVGRATLRKVREATATDVLRRGNEVLQGVIAERQLVFQEAERIARQLLAVAELKGLLPTGDAQAQQRFVYELRDRVTEDPGLATAHAHLVGLVGATDTLIFLDRALPSVQ
jgi:hypothetical protein